MSSDEDDLPLTQRIDLIRHRTSKRLYGVEVLETESQKLRNEAESLLKSVLQIDITPPDKKRVQFKQSGRADTEVTRPELEGDEGAEQVASPIGDSSSTMDALVVKVDGMDLGSRGLDELFERNLALLYDYKRVHGAPASNSHRLDLP